MRENTIHDDRTRMNRDSHLIEPDPYSETEFRWRSKWELEEWVYDQGYDCGIDELWKMLPGDELRNIGRLYLQEGPEAVEVWLDEEIATVIDTTINEWLETYVDGQMRLYAGYDVAENGDTLEEGSYGTWEDLRMIWEAGFQDKLRGRERYSSIE